jgi:hypothetical protein
MTEAAIRNFDTALQLAPGDEQVRKELEELKKKTRSEGSLKERSTG